MRGVISKEGWRSFEWIEAVTTSSWSSMSSSWSSVPSRWMSTSMPLSRVNESPRLALIAATRFSWSARRSRVRPLATVSRGEWSVSAIHSCPSWTAASTISSMGLPPSLQFECACRSPRSAAYSPAPSVVSGAPCFSSVEAR